MTVRSGLEPPFTSPESLFRLSHRAWHDHGYVMPTLFIMGFGYFVSVTSLDRPLPSMRLAWAGFWLVIVGVRHGAACRLPGKATVLYTFYPPLTGSVFYYIGSGSRRRRLMGLGRPDDLGDGRLEERQSRQAGSTRHVGNVANAFSGYGLRSASRLNFCFR